MQDVVAQRSRISQESHGYGENRMQNLSGNRSQFGQASVGSIHIGDQKQTCPFCRNIIALQNKSLICFECKVQFCEECEGWFRHQRKRGERPLCGTCYEKQTKQREEERRGKETRCGNCGRRVPDEAKLCGYCGFHIDSSERITIRDVLLDPAILQRNPHIDPDDEFDLMELFEDDDDKVGCGNCHSQIPADASVCPVCGVQFED